MLCYAMLCYAMLCYAMLCYAMLCSAMSIIQKKIQMLIIHLSDSDCCSQPLCTPLEPYCTPLLSTLTPSSNLCTNTYITHSLYHHIHNSLTVPPHTQLTHRRVCVHALQTDCPLWVRSQTSKVRTSVRGITAGVFFGRQCQV